MSHKKTDWMGLGKLDPGGGLAGRFSTTSSSRRQCWWWGRIWFISHCDSFYKLCQLSALSASILRLPEQTKTGATEALSGLQTARADRNWCHSGERRLAAGLARGGISRYHLVLTIETEKAEDHTVLYHNSQVFRV